MKKRIITIALVVALLATCFAGTLAYLTDTDAAHNTMTVGKVTIEQTEWQRNGAGDFVPFEKDKLLMPGVYDTVSASWKVPFNDADSLMIADGEAWCGFWGTEKDGYEFAGNDPAWITKCDTYNALDKIVVVKNTGDQPCYYRTLIALEVASATVIMNVNGNERFDWGNDEKDPVCNIEIDGTKYAVYAATYTKVLAPTEVSRPSLLQVMLDKNTTNEQVAQFGDKVDILCLSQAVQSAGFPDAETALNEAFGAVTVANATEWLTPIAQAQSGAIDPTPATPAA